MAEEFEGRDLSDAVFWGVDLSRARFRDVDLTGVRVSHARLVDVGIDGLVDRVTINGVDVTDYVNDRDRWYPLRAMIRPDSPDGMRAAWRALDAVWAATIQRAGKLTLDHRIRLRLATTYGMNEATDVSVACYRAAGTTAIMNSAPFERRFRDAMSASQHLQAMMPHIEMVGRHIIGVDNPIQHI